MDVRQENIAKAHSATCQWLYDRPEYKAWRDPNHRADHHGFFWIKSKPGAGKSTLMKFLLNSAKQRLPQDKIISFFFNARGDQLEHSIEGMYRHLLHQLLKTIPRLQNVLKLPNAYDAFQHGWPVEKLKSLFQEAVLSLKEDRLTCFIDALDECPEDQARDMIGFLEDLGLSFSGAFDLHICFASRHYPNINIAKCQRFTLDGQEEHEQDIASYVKQKLHGGSKKIETIRVAIREKAHGVFLWAVLVVQILIKEIDRGQVHNIQRRLEEIPPGLHELFQDILSRDSEDDKYIVPILRWIMFAKRPLSREELYFAIHSGAPNSIALEPWDSEDIELKSMDLFILHCSKGLAEMTRGKKPTVQFIHESVRDYLRETGLRILQPNSRANSDGSSHDYLKQCCWNLISEKVLGHLDLPTPLPKAKSDEAKQLRELASRQFPFLQYAYRYMTHHAELASSHGVRQAGFVKSFPTHTWAKIHNNFAIHGTRRLEGSTVTIFDLLILQKNWHLFELCIRLEECPLSPDQSEAAFSEAPNSDTAASLMPLFDELVSATTPTTDHLLTLKLAMNTQSLAALRVTLKRIPRVTLANNDVAILEHASHLGNPDVLTCLIDHGLTISGVLPIPETAISNGHEAFVMLLLQLLPKIDHGALTRAKALRQALGKENLSMARAMLQDAHNQGMGIHYFSGVLENALREASGAGNYRLVQLFLEIGANPSSGIIQASKAGHEAVARLLFDNDCGAEPIYTARCRAFHEASSAGHEAVVRLLLDKGVDINSATESGKSALHEASHAGHEAVVRLLLTDGADINIASFKRRSALHEASQAGHEAVVRMLLENGADIDVTTTYGQTALDKAYSNGHGSIVKLLLDERHRCQDASRPLARSTSGETGEPTAPLPHESDPEFDTREDRNDEEITRDSSPSQDASGVGSVDS